MTYPRKNQFAVEATGGMIVIGTAEISRLLSYQTRADAMNLASWLVATVITLDAREGEGGSPIQEGWPRRIEELTRLVRENLESCADKQS